MQDGEIRKAFQRSLTKQGFKFKLGVKVNSAKVEGTTVTLDTETVKDGKKEQMKADVVLVSAGNPIFGERPSGRSSAQKHRKNLISTTAMNPLY